MIIWGNDLMFSFEEPEGYTPQSSSKNCLEHAFFFGVLYFFKASILFKSRISAFLVGVCSVAVCSLLFSDVVLRETI